MASWASAQRRLDQDIARVAVVEPVPERDDEDVAPEGVIWTAFHREDAFLQRTNFLEVEITALVQQAQPYIAMERRRGPAPKSSWSDAFLCYLTWARHDFDYATGARLCGITEGRFEDDVARARGVLLRCLRAKWWAPPPRPAPLVGTTFPHVALLIHTNTIETFRPKAPFEEAKVMWDGKNHIYGLKKEVGVAARAPHYCLFTQPARVASVHDYSIIKETCESYTEYLLKTPDERAALVGDREHRFWAALLDKAYVGPAQDTPNLRRIVPVKRPVTVADEQHNHNVNALRAPIEQFFGRLWQCWAVLRHAYRLSHTTFDDDYDLLCLLTNELISNTALNEQDKLFYDQVRTLRRQSAEKKDNKRKEAQKRSKDNKARRLARE
jgi:hypothetical protein